MKRRANQAEINFVAHAIADVQSCGSCAGCTDDGPHCRACTEEAIAAIEALNKYRDSLADMTASWKKNVR